MHHLWLLFQLFELLLVWVNYICFNC